MPKTSSMRVLIVDDQKTMLALVRASLKRIGVTNIFECGDGKEALQKLQIEPVDLIISDMNMPNLDGLGLLGAVRHDEKLKAMPFIMLTSRGDENLVKQALELKVNNYLTKPFSVDGLKRKMELVLGPME